MQKIEADIKMKIIDSWRGIIPSGKVEEDMAEHQKNLRRLRIKAIQVLKL
jgi:hypothetical protein